MPLSLEPLSRPSSIKHGISSESSASPHSGNIDTDITTDLKKENICPGQQQKQQKQQQHHHHHHHHQQRQQQPNSDVGRMRWAILASGCFILFGNYYAFDNPAALNQPLQEYMRLTNDEYAYFLNLLYTVYSIPNIFLPWVVGYIAHRIGHHRLMIVVSLLVVLGHMVVCLGLEHRNKAVMLFGRVVFGLAESLNVVQASITIKYFRGKELAMALGINLCVARLGTVLNDIVTPIIWSIANVPTAFWGGFVVCVLSCLSAVVVVSLDRQLSRRYNNTESGHGEEPAEPHGRGRDHRHRHCFPSRKNVTEQAQQQEPSGLGPLSSSSKVATLLFENENNLEQQELTLQNADWPPPNHAEQRPSKARMFATNARKLMSGMAGFSLATWLLLAMGCLLLGVIVPFNSIHAGFLQMRWYHNDPKKASQITTVPDLLAAILVIPFGYFVDHYGQKSWLFMLSGLLAGSSHVALGLFRIPSPVPALITLGISMAIQALFQSVLPKLVSEDQLATVFGLYISGMNFMLVVIPMIVAKLMTIDPNTYTYVEIMFVSIGYFGFGLA
ncbi:hypothetical protein BG004_002789, partial [Podila humilis]